MSSKSSEEAEAWDAYVGGDPRVVTGASEGEPEEPVL